MGQNQENMEKNFIKWKVIKMSEKNSKMRNKRGKLFHQKTTEKNW